MDFNTLTLKMHLSAESFLCRKSVQATLLVAACVLLTDPVCAAITDDLKDAVIELQSNIFGSGWVTIGKIAAAGVGVVMAIARSSLVPFASGAAVSAAIHFFQKHTESAAACLF